MDSEEGEYIMENAYICGVCQDGFMWKSDLSKNMETVHHSEKLDCTQCNKTEWRAEYDMDLSDMELDKVCADILKKTRVVHLKRRHGFVVQNCDIYIGRQIQRGGWSLSQSDWANPFTIKQCGSAQEAILLYEKYIRNERPDLLQRIPDLYGKTLGCWCKPGPCHGDILVKLFEEYKSNNAYII